MKNLFIALICTVIGFNASASDLTPKKTTSTVKHIEVKIDMAKTETKSSKINNTISSKIRRSFGWKFQDECGNTMTVWCSGTNIDAMYAAAEAYADDHTSWWTGCFK